MANERNGKDLEKSVRVLQNVSTSIVMRGLDDLTFLAKHTSAEFFVQKGNACYNSEDYHQAIMYFSQAMRLDPQNVEAQFEMGKMYHEGQGVPQDYAEAVKWFRKAAEQGFAKAQFNLGVMYAKGEGVPQDYAQAVNWYRKAAEQGLAEGQWRLGFMYYKCKGVPKDYTEALKWYRKAADQEQVQAQYDLGFMYDKGHGVPHAKLTRKRNGYQLSLAYFWNGQAADQGDAKAQYSLGRMYRDGECIPQDYVLAHMWFNLAAAQGKPEARRLRDLLAEQMTPSQIAEAQRLAREWKPKGQD